MKLDEFLKAKAKDDKRNKFRFLRITGAALLKAQRCAQLVAEEIGPFECMGYLLSDDASGVVTDAMLAPDQRVTGASVRIDGSAVIKAGSEIRRSGKRCVGWFHSHCTSPFHSATDDKNTEILLNQIAPFNCETVETERILLTGALNTVADGNTMIISDYAKSLELTLKGDAKQEELDVTQVKLRETEYIGHVYSLVVTADSDETYAEIALKKWCDGCDDEEVKSYKVDVRVVDAEEEKLREEIRQKIAGPPSGMEAAKSSILQGLNPDLVESYEPSEKQPNLEGEQCAHGLKGMIQKGLGYLLRLGRMGDASHE